jgi:hypothetical protein
VFVFYDGPTPPNGIFNNFTDLGADLDTTQTWDSYYDLVCFIIRDKCRYELVTNERKLQLQDNDQYDLR